MKYFFAALLMSFANVALACPQKEAQIAAIVSGIQMNAESCTALVKSSDIQFFSSSTICPMSPSEVISLGVTVGLKEGQTCSLQVGDEFSGVIYRVNGQIYLE